MINVLHYSQFYLAFLADVQEVQYGEMTECEHLVLLKFLKTRRPGCLA